MRCCMTSSNSLYSSDFMLSLWFKMVYKGLGRVFRTAWIDLPAQACGSRLGPIKPACRVKLG
jgi:hypothetical protein